MNYALITGGTSGIGLELARIFAKNKYSLVLTARKRGDLEKTAADLAQTFNAEVKIFAADLSLPEAPRQIFGFCQTENITIDTLVNNAGFGMYGFFAEQDAAGQLGIIDLNIGALTQLTKLFLPGMLERGNGKILNVASTAAFQPGPLMAVYYASKAYVLSFSQALGNELKSKNIFVTALCPGPTKTNFQNIAKNFTNTRLLRRMSMMSAASVAEAGYRGLLKNKPVVIPGMRNKILAFLTRFGPRRLVTDISRWMLEQG